MISRELILVILFCVASIVGSVGLLFISDQIKATNHFMQFEVIAQILLLIGFRLSVTETKLQTVLSAIIILSCGELIDELFFNPTIWQWNEVAFFVMALTYLYFKLCTRKRN